MIAIDAYALDGFALLERRLDDARLKWRWSMRDDSTRELLVLAAPWRPTGLELAGHAFYAEQLLEACPNYPMACIRLVSPALARPPEGYDGLEGLKRATVGLEADAQQAEALGQWLRDAANAIDREIKRVAAEGEATRKAISASKLSDWHISSCDQRARTIRVDGRSLQLSIGQPAGEAADLSTIFLGPLFKQRWKPKYRPRFGLISADYGTHRIKVEVGKGGRRMPAYWIDLSTGVVTPA